MNRTIIAAVNILAIAAVNILAIAAIPIPDPVVVPMKIADKYYVQRILIDTDSNSIQLTVPLGTGDGDAFRPMGQPAQVDLNTIEFGQLIAALRECKDANGVNAYDRACALLIAKIQSSGVLVIREQP